MSDPSRFSSLIAAATDRRGIVALLTGLGFRPRLEAVPRPAWAAYGVAGAADVTGLAVAARAGALDVLAIRVRGAVGAERARALAGSVRGRNPVRLHLFLFHGGGGLVLGTFGERGDFRYLALDPAQVRASDLDALDEMTARDGEHGLALALRHARALDRSRVTRMFFKDFRVARAAVASSFVGLPDDARRERAQLAILLLCRLTFLYFLQRRRTLCGDDRYLVRLFASRRPGRRTFYRERLVPLFFEALNRPAEERSEAARALGDLPYLNGGLFEPHSLERRYPALDLPDAAVRAIFEGLLERYRFTSREAGAGGGAGFGVDPEVLGQVFEGLMASSDRLETGTYYTPAPVVHRVVREGLTGYLAGACPGVDSDAVLNGHADLVPASRRTAVARSLERIRVLDPACGSGAFLLGALHHLGAALASVSGAPEPLARREVVARSLHGVDLLDDAALLCSLRLWLALSEEEDGVRPLPNLDRRIRQGDALVEPLDLSLADAGTGANPMADPALRRACLAVGPAARRYLESWPADRAEARAELVLAEQRLARQWVDRGRRLQDHRLRNLRAQADDRDLFGDLPDTARRARSALPGARARAAEIERVARHLEEKGSLPFFSFGVHFADAGGAFDLIVTNPPWVRAHRWPERIRRVASRQYEVARAPGWPAARFLVGTGAAGGGQVDLSLLFLERSCRLLAPGGVLAVLVPAKAMRALYGGGARRMLLRDLEFALIEDHALDQRSMFRADAFAAVLVLRRPRTAPSPGRPVAGEGRDLRVRMVRRSVPPLEFSTVPEELPLFRDDPASPWIVAPPEVVSVLRRMQRAGPPLGRHEGLRVRRGVMTGANDVLVMATVAPRLGGLARIEAAGYGAARKKGKAARVAGRFRAWVETEGLRPLVRGADVDRFRYQVGAHLVWCHGEDGDPRDPPPRLARYLHRHRRALEARAGWRPALPLGCVFRLSADTLLPKVAWHDLSDRLRAVALPARTSFDGAARELVPLNTVYFLPQPDTRDALIMAAVLNSLPAGVFARAIAERAKDARFRFFAWTLACLPLPEGWRAHAAAADLLELSQRAHDRGGMTPESERHLDLAVAALYGLEPADLEVLHRFDRWLRGAP